MQQMNNIIKANVIIGCIMGSCLTGETKEILVEYMRKIEEMEIEKVEGSKPSALLP